MNNLLKQFKNILFRTLILSVLFISSCSKNEDPPNSIAEEPKISSFSFQKAQNPNLPFDIHLDIENNTITGRIPINTDVKNLAASFEHNGSEVFANNLKQTSGITKNNFTTIVTYAVKAS